MGLRDLIIPDPGKLLCQTDQAGADALIVAYLCRNGGNYRKIFEYGIKPKVYNALVLYKEKWDNESPGLKASEALAIPIENLKGTPGWPELASYVSRFETETYIGKKVGHASNYGQHANTFINDVLNESDGKIVLTRQQGERYLGLYDDTFPEIKGQFQSYIRAQLEHHNKTLRNLFGYPITFIGVWGEDLFRKAYAWIPQSTVGIITEVAFTEIQERIEIKDPLLEGVDLLQDGHDAILYQCPIGRESVVIPEVEKHINRELVNPWGEHFFMKSETQTGMDWGNLKNFKL